MKVLAIVQARMSSTRLPGKVLLDLEGAPVLTRVMRRLSRAKTLGAVVVAIPTGRADDPLAALCRKERWGYVRGPEEDVLSRYYETAQRFGPDAVVRVTSDCPLIEPSVVDRVVREFLARQPGVSYASNTLHPRTYPRGLDTEVMTMRALERAWREDRDPATREHVTPYLYRNPGLFSVHAVIHDQDLSAMRWTLDTPEDLDLIRRIYSGFDDDAFSWTQTLELLRAHPDWMKINSNVQQKPL